MRKRSIGRGLLLAGIAALALGLTTGGAVAGNGKGKAYGKLAAKSCAQEKKAIGKADFGLAYGKPAMPNCIGVVRKAANSEAKNAAKECKAEGLKGKEYGKCVSAKVKEDVNEDRTDRVNAAKECKAEREDPTTIPGNTEGKTFEEFYGTNNNAKGKGKGKNAFGKCVSAKAKAKHQEEEPPVEEQPPAE